MAYGLWLYKEIETKQGSRRIEIHKRNYTGASIEIDALADDGVVLSMDGGDITDPIIGTTLSLSIIDTEQIDTSLFFTPDATLYRVQLFFGATLEWIGYLTPDSYSENLAYRDIVSLVARDNLGRLNDYTFDTERGMMSIQELIDTLLGEVSCPMYLNWRSTKVANVADANTAVSIKATDAFVDTHYFVGKTYREIVEEVLKGIGCQMRFSGQNNLSILDLAQIPTLDTKDAFFIEKSGYKEIRPAWKDVTIEQDYGKVDNFFDGYLNEEQSGSSTFFIPSEQMPGKWEGDSLYFANQYGWNTGIEDNQSESIYPAINTKLPQNSYAIYKKEVRSTNQMVSLTMSLNNTARRLKNVVFNSTSNLYTGEDGRVKYTLTYMFSVYMRDKSGKMYIMLKDRWSEDTGNDLNPLPILFKMPECIYEDQGTWNKEQEVSIQINSLPSDGELLILFHNVGWSESDSITDYQYFGKIRDIRLAYTNDIGGQSSRIQLDSVHNIQSSIQFSIGQVPYGKGDNNAYWGGLFTSAKLPLSSWSMSEDSALKYNLLELVGREHIHYNKKNYELLSGTMMSDSSLSLDDNITYKGKIYAIISAALNILSGRLNITSMQEVEEYEVAVLTIIDSPVESSSGTRLGSGNNEVIQFSNDSGYAKRLYELDQSSQEDMEDSYVIIDKPSMSAAKKLPISAIGGFFEEDENRDIRLKDKDGQGKRNLTNIGKLEMGQLILPTEDEKPSNYALSVGEVGTGANTPTEGGGSNVSFVIPDANLQYGILYIDGIQKGVLSINGHKHIPSDITGLDDLFEEKQDKITQDNKLDYDLLENTPDLSSLEEFTIIKDQEGNVIRIDTNVGMQIGGDSSVLGKLTMGTLVIPNAEGIVGEHTLMIGEVGAGAATPEGGGSGTADFSQIKVYDTNDVLLGNGSSSGKITMVPYPVVPTKVSAFENDEGYLKEEDIEGKVDKVDGKGLSTEDFTTALKTKLQGLSNYDDKAINDKIDDIQGQIDTLVSGGTATAIESFNEIIAFLDGVEDTETLEGIIAAIEQQIASKVSTETFNALATRVGTAETAIATNATAIATNATDISNLKTRANGLQGNIEDLQGDVTAILDDYLSKANGGIIKGAVTIQAALKMNTLYLPNSNNTPSDYQMSVGVLGSGADTPSGGSGIAQVTINVNGSPYKTNANGEVTLPNYPTSLPASDVYAWAKKSSLAASDVPDLSSSYMSINLGGIPMSTTTNLNRVGYGYVGGGWIYSGPAIAFGSSNGYTALLQQKAGGYELRVSYKANGVASGSWKTIAFTSDLDGYLPLSGGVMTRAISLASIRYFDYLCGAHSQEGGILGNNSDIFGINAIYTADAANSATEGIHFKRTNSNWDTLSSYDGTLYYYPNRVATNESWTNAYTLIHSGNIGNQSVNYASSAGDADKLGGYGLTRFLLMTGRAYTEMDLNTLGGSQSIFTEIRTSEVTTTNSPHSGYGALLSLKDSNRIAKMQFLGSSNSSVLYFRSQQSISSNITSVWKTIAFTDSNVASANILAKVYANENINYGRDNVAMRIILGAASNSVSLGYPGQYFSGLSVTTGYTGWQMVTYGGSSRLNPYFRKQIDDGSWLDWRQLAFLDDNVASATKLQTARTIWGQSFDGSRNVNGIPEFPYIIDINRTQSGTLIDSTKLGLEIEAYSSNVRFKTYGATNNVSHLVLTSDGNVLIGTTTDNGAKLQVNGGIRPSITASYALGNASYTWTDVWCKNIINNTTDGFLVGSRLSVGATDGGALIYSYGNAPISFYTNSSERMRITGGGNVGVHTIEPQQPLHIVGATRIQRVGDAGTYLDIEVGDVIVNYKGVNGNDGFCSHNFLSNGTSLFLINGHEGKVYTNGTLDVASIAYFGNTEGCDIYLRRANGNSYITATSSLMLCVNGNSGNYALGIDTSKNATFYGNVGIGVTNPTSKLQVNGNISASGIQLPTSAPSNPASGGYYLYVGTLGTGATIS